MTKGKCSQKCLKACTAGAIDFNDTEIQDDLHVGSIIFSPGYDVFPAQIKSEYGYQRYPNVVTSIEFERILSASGPYEGHIQRPSDGVEPKKIAWINCVGSRDNACGNNYCSSVCCTYSIKEAVIAKEHIKTIEPTIFYMDMRTFGKGFERYYNRAKDEQHIRFVRSRISHIEEDPSNDNLVVRYEDESGQIHDETFDMVVLSVGFIINDHLRTLAKKMGLQVNDFGFIEAPEFSPLQSGREGIYVCGAFAGPKDIPETVMQASAASIKASKDLEKKQASEAINKMYPSERDVSDEEPRIGVFICHCGINIAGYVHVDSLLKFSKRLPHVVYAEENIYSCSQDTQKNIAEKIKKHHLNRVIVASCTPRTHEPLFQETIRQAGLNPYLFEMANIRDQCSWVHMEDKQKATEKAKDQIKMIVAKAADLQPLAPIEIELNQHAVVIGGGIAGMTAALTIADQGYDVHLIEKEKELGGNARNFHYTLEGNDPQTFLKELISRVHNHQKITLYTRAIIEAIDGHVGAFRTTIKNGVGTIVLEHGVVVVATGAVESSPDEYLFGEDEGVVSQLDFESLVVDGSGFDGKTVVMIQCVGSREEHRPYCSRVCCADALKNAIMVKERYPDAQVFVLYRDMRAYGFKEMFYERARELGVIFVRFDLDGKPVVKRVGSDLQVMVVDRILNEELLVHADVVVLSPAIVAGEDNEGLAKMLKVPLNEDGFFLEAHVKLRPVDFATEGVFLAGLAHSPKTISESIIQANAAAARACVLLSQGTIEVEPIISTIDETACIGCGLCVSLCPSNAIELKLKEGGRKAEVIAAACKGCGLCGASCPQKAITMQHFRDKELLAQIMAFGGG